MGEAMMIGATREMAKKNFMVEDGVAKLRKAWVGDWKVF
jgi:hypothetical protein